jgi:hypothetical protein
MAHAGSARAAMDHPLVEWLSSLPEFKLRNGGEDLRQP